MTKLYRHTDSNKIYNLQELIEVATGKSIDIDYKYCRKTADYKKIIRYQIELNDSVFSVSQMIFLKSLVNLPDKTEKTEKQNYLRFQIETLREKHKSNNDINKLSNAFKVAGLNWNHADDSLDDLLQRLKIMVDIFNAKFVYVFND